MLSRFFPMIKKTQRLHDASTISSPISDTRTDEPIELLQAGPFYFHGATVGWYVVKQYSSLPRALPHPDRLSRANATPLQ